MNRRNYPTLVHSPPNFGNVVHQPLELQGAEVGMDGQAADTLKFVLVFRVGARDQFIS